MQIARASDHGENPALTAYKRGMNNYVFLSGGYSENSFLSKVEVYNVDKDQWSPCPNLNNPRECHASCILGEKLYVSGGDNVGGDTIEVADCSKLLNGSATWEILNVRYKAYFHVFSPLTSHEILIMAKEDISIFETRSCTIRKVGTVPFKLVCYNN